MADQITISKTLSIRDCGLDEYWLQDQVFANPSILGLGDLDVVAKEKQQSSGGKLDLLLKDPEDDTMYEVEIMLGETDASHIIRTIEYWDLERKRWAKRQHIAVLVAESITRRFFNVIQLLSGSIPLVAIQANIIEAGEKRVLHFTKILNIYEEPEEEGRGPSGSFNEQWWRTNAPANVTNAEALVALAGYPLEMGFTKNYISLGVDGGVYFAFRSRSGGKSRLSFWLSNTNVAKVPGMLDQTGFPYDLKPYRSGGEIVRMTVDRTLIQSKLEVFKMLSEVVKHSWENTTNTE